MNVCTSAAGHFDGHVDALKQYGVHCPMQHNQGFTGSHCARQSGDYSLCIILMAARVTIKKTMMQNVPTLLAVSMTIPMWRYTTVCII
jgi:hypothetical protein